MGRPRVVHCKRCGRHENVAGQLSWAKLCAQCGETAQLENVRQLIACDGPRFRHWQRQCALTFQYVLDEPRERA